MDFTISLDDLDRFAHDMESEGFDLRDYKVVRCDNHSVTIHFTGEAVSYAYMFS